MSSLGTRGATQVFLDTLRVYFSPVTGFRKSDNRLERIYSIESGRRAASIDAFNLARDVASYNQGALIEYVFMLAERHKGLRLAVERRQEDLKSLTDDLIRLMNHGFFESISKNFEYLHRHFDGRSPRSPRMAVKGNWRTEDKDKIITIFRDRPMGYGEVFLLEENSGISYCAKFGRPYLCNNIVDAVIEGNYINPRISYSAVRKVIGNRPRWLRRAALARRWQEVWTTKGSDSSSEYRSTLVVPIAIANERLSKEILERFNAVNSERMIFGYLCFDHLDIDYFDEDIDVPMALMVADILSVFAFQRLRFTDFSHTFKFAEQKLDLDEHLESLKLSMEDVIQSVRVALEGKDDGGIRDNDKTTRNALLNTDELLLKLLEDPSGPIELASEE